MSSRDNVEDGEKVDQPVQKRGFFSRTSTPKPDTKEKGAETGDKPAEPQLPPVSLLQLFRFSTPFELFLDAIGLIAAAAAGSAQPLMTLLFGRLTQDFVNFTIILGQVESGNPDSQVALEAAAASFRHEAGLNALYLVVIGVGVFVATFVYMYTWVYTGEVNAKRIREKYLQAILRQDIAYFDNVGAGEVATRIQTDTHLVQQGMSEKIAVVAHFLGAFVAGYALAYARCWRLGLALTSVLPCIALTGAFMNIMMTKYTQASLNEVASSGNITEEVISTIRTAQAFGTQHVLAGLYDGFINKAHVLDTKAAMWHGAGLAIFFFVNYNSYALAFSFGVTLVNGGHATVGEVVNVILAIMIGSFSLALMAPELQAVAGGRAAAAKLFQTIDRVPDIDSANPEGQRLPDTLGQIHFQDVRFNYPSRPAIEILKGLTLTFQAGKTAALVGASGSGKSTIISLVERFYDPTYGSVTLDGVDVRNLNIKWLRSQIGLVSQEPILFATTIKSNVAHGLTGTQYEHASEEEKFTLIKEACIKANADGFISKLPNGYDTMVGERGFLLSGGQKQRIAIARAIVSDPHILLLDEATSALDTQSEGIVQDALDKAAAGRTTITIAHRLSTVKDADVIHVLGDGLVLESGTHQELLARDGAYARLVYAQGLREGKQGSTSGDNGDEPEDIDKAAREEIPLGRRDTGTSFASEILEQRRKATKEKEKQGDYSLLYLLKRMGQINRASWHYYVLGAITACVTGAVYPVFGIIFAKGVNAFALDNHDRRVQGDQVALYLFITAIVASLAIGVELVMCNSAATTLTAKLRSLSFRAILRQDIEFFDRDENSTGGLTASLSDNPQKFFGLAGSTLGAIVQAIASVIIGSTIGLVYIWKVGLVSLACTPVLISAGYIRLRVVVLKDQANKKLHAESAQVACEAAASIRTVASLTREDDCLDIYSKSLEVPLHRSNRTALWSNLLYALSQAMMFFAIALVFWYGATLVSRLEFSTFDFFIGLMSSTFSALQAGNVFQFVPDMSAARGAGSDMIKLLDSVPEIDAESPDGKRVDPSQVRGQLRLENIHFRYPTRPGVRVLRDLTLRVEPGTYVALVGASGCGKSTIIQLLERFYDPLAGEIYIDDQLISDLNVQDYRKQIALVSQEPTLYSGTIRFNVLLGAIKPKEEVTQEELEAACRSANILDFINELPDGFETEVGGKGSQLSGGQKQRIAIARALLRNPKVLLLDEATSALDSNSEKVVQDALDQAVKGRTTIAIAHRLATIQNANKIYFIKEGRVSESGTHDQLLAKRGDYYQYVQLQALSKRD